MFCPIVCVVCFAGPQEEFELLLTFSVVQPMEPHVHGFSAFWLHFSIYYCICHSIACLDGGGRLLVTHFLQYDSNIYCLSCHDVVMM